MKNDLYKKKIFKKYFFAAKLKYLVKYEFLKNSPATFDQSHIYKQNAKKNIKKYSANLELHLETRIDRFHHSTIIIILLRI